MRTVILWLVAIAMAACGPSSGAIKSAKEARYKGDKLAMFEAAKGAVAAKLQLETTDETRLAIESVLRWYNPDGLLVSERGGDVRDIPDRAISLKLVVQLVPDGDAYVVRVKPMMMRRFKDRPNPDVLGENDPSIPGWMTSKLDMLALAVHDALAAYEVKTPASPASPPVVPPPDEPGATPPREPSPGSGAP